MTDLIIILIIALLAAIAVAKIIKNRGGCSCGCGGCTNKSCKNNTNKETEDLP